MVRRLYLLLFFALPLFAQINLPYAVTIKIKPVDNSVDAFVVKELKLELEKLLQKDSGFFNVISTDFDDDLIETMIRGHRDWTREDLLSFGNVELFKHIIICEPKIEKSAFKKTKWLSFIHVIETETAQKIVSEKMESNKSIQELAKLCYDRIYHEMCLGEIILTVNQPDVRFVLNSKSLKLDQKSIRQEVSIGDCNLQLAKSGYRSYDTTFVLNPGDIVRINKQLILKGQNIHFDGAPSGANLLISGSKFKERRSIPHQSRMPEGNYRISLTAPGYLPIRNQRLQVVDSDDGRALKYELKRIQHSFFIKRSSILAGWGQYSLGYKGGGLLLSFGEISSVGLILFSQYKILNLQRQMDDLLDSYPSKTGDDAIRIHQQILDKENSRDFYYLTRNLSTATLIGVYVYNLIDIILIKGSHNKEENKKPFIPDDSIFDNIGLNFSNEHGITLSWRHLF